jgi:hypothetical protein
MSSSVTQRVHPPDINSTAITRTPSTSLPMINSINPYRQTDSDRNSSHSGIHNSRIPDTTSQVSINDKLQQHRQQISSNQIISMVSIPAVFSVATTITQTAQQQPPHNAQNIQNKLVPILNKHQSQQQTRAISVLLSSLSPPPSLSSASQMKIGIDYRQLRELLIRAIQCESIYHQIYGKIYTVQNMVQVGTKLHFNIEKNKSRTKEDSNKANKSDKVRLKYIQTVLFLR